MNFIKKQIKYLKKRIKKIIFYLKLRDEVKSKRKINVGSGNLSFNNDWFSCDIDILDITKKRDWYLLLGRHKVLNIFAEHVWEHLSDKDTDLANKYCYRFLKKNGRLRLAVPDGNHPNKDYIDYVKPNGNGLGADDHKILYNYSMMKEKLEKAGFKIQLLEYWDESGKFHYMEWNDEDGKVMRSKRYDSRNQDGALNYTSLIIDAIK